MAEVEEQNSTRIEVEEYLLLEEGEDPHIVTLDGLRNIKNGIKFKHLDLEPTEASRDGRKTHGVIAGVIETIGSTIDTQMKPIKERDTTPVVMRRGRGQEAPPQEDIEEENTAPSMNMKEEEEGQERTTALMKETVGDTPAMTDEESAQGP